ncbi:RadC family protein [Ignavigranum ruoffiae]|uniref:RadC family protein n=1 Tax=Ignavigranum ruoffiae TaxID=89093 RepID=UPI002071307F|nr:DNA repair protein RadC [Ignavigranum ruoffiae]UPQ85339.1 DNA repair protein RadC [Ignavigranum ruoffiae]
MNSKIASLPTNGQPRERLLNYGEKALADYELLAILLRTGTKQCNVLDLATQILCHFETGASLQQASIDELQAVKGVGPIKAIEIKAAIEFGYRMSMATQPKLGTMMSTEIAGQWLVKEMAQLHQEHLLTLFLNSKNEIIKKKTIFMGTVNSSVAHPREIFKEAVKFPTARIIIAHNHPSGDVEPSQADLDFTRRLIVCGEIMGIEILDHIIIGQERYLSLREETNIFE